MRSVFLAVTLVACAGTGSTKDTGSTTHATGSTGATGTTGTTGSTGSTADTGGALTCDFAPLTFQSCLETTASQAGDTATPYYAPTVVQGSGTVTDVGGALGAIAGSVPIQGFTACTADHDHQVRLVDGNGDTWTFGWDLSGAVDDASTDTIEAGAAVDFYAIWEFLGYSSAGAMLLSDATGPLFLLELEPELDDAQRGGVTVQLHQDSCVSADGYLEFYQVRFGWSSGSVDLWSGQSALVPLPARSVNVTLGASSWMLECLDGCGQDWWAEWAEK